MPLSRKRGRDNFKQLVKDCACPIKVLTKERIEKFASRARAYICTYHHLEQLQQQVAAAAVNEDPNSSATARIRVTPIPTHIKQELLSYSDIERVKKDFRSHRFSGSLSKISFPPALYCMTELKSLTGVDKENTTTMASATVPDSNTWGSAPASNSGGTAGLLSFVTGTNGAASKPDSRVDRDAWTLGGRQFASSREVYTRSLYRICLKFTTSEDEDEGKPEPATAFWTLYGRSTTIGNGGPSSHTPDDICRRMDDSMTGPSAGLLSRLNDLDGELAAAHAQRSGMTTGWHVRGDRGDAAVRVGKAKVFNSNQTGPDGLRRDAQILTLDADRWALIKGTSFAAGNSVFNVEDYNEAKQRITIHCSKGPMRGKLIDVHASRCPFVFGRAHEADLCIMDRELSRRHGAILYVPSPNNRKGKGKAGGVFILTDLESTNGSYLRLVGPYAHKGLGALSIGDEFIVGRTGFSVNRFDYGISEAIGARPTMEDRTVVFQSLLYETRHGYFNGEAKKI
ncbi:Sigma factor PP2C-like phosphatase [Fragilaria crotonensis]|nr:Sigma factor PP2C-like phosphatase [Fragilaria crotonensis]